MITTEEDKVRNGPNRIFRISPSGRLFKSCSPDRFLKITDFLGVVTELFGVCHIDEKEIQATPYCRLDRYAGDPRWIRVYPYPMNPSFVVAFFIEKGASGTLAKEAEAIGLHAEEGRQRQSLSSERLRVHIDDQYDVQSSSFIRFVQRLLKSYERTPYRRACANRANA